MIIALVVLLWLGMGVYGSALIYNYNQLSRQDHLLFAEGLERMDFYLAYCGTPFGALFLLVVSLLLDDDCCGPRWKRYKYVNGVRQP